MLSLYRPEIQVPAQRRALLDERKEEAGQLWPTQCRALLVVLRRGRTALLSYAKAGWLIVIYKVGLFWRVVELVQACNTGACSTQGFAGQEGGRSRTALAYVV